MKQQPVTLIIIAILLIGVFVGWLTYLSYTNLENDRAIEKTRLLIRESMKDYLESNSNLVGYCTSPQYQNAVSGFAGNNECLKGTNENGKDLNINLTLANNSWRCSMVTPYGYRDVEIFECTKLPK